MTDDLSNELSDALRDLLAPLPPLATLDPDVLRKGARRRRTKVAALGGTGALALVGIVAALTIPRHDDQPSRLTVAPTQAPTPSEAPTPTASPTPSAAASPPGVLILEPDGLGYLSGPSSIRHEPFATTDAATVQQVVSSTLGQSGVSTPLPDCGAAVTAVAYRRGEDTLTVYLDGTHFAGWSDNSRGPVAAGTQRLTTADGVGLGSTLAELRQSFNKVVVTTATVGPEWSVPGGLAGGLDGTQPQSTVNRIGAGQTCIFR